MSDFSPAGEMLKEKEGEAKHKERKSDEEQAMQRE